MKSGSAKEILVTQAEMAAILGISLARYHEQMASGVIPRFPKGQVSVAAVVQSYTAHLREVAAGRMSDSAESHDLVEQRARLAHEQADAQAMKNSMARGELLQRAEVLGLIQAAIVKSRSRLLAMPSRLAPQVAGMESLAEINAAIKDHVYEALDELATMRLEPGDVEPVADGDGDLDAAAGSDGQRVGGQRAKAKSRGKRRTRKVVNGAG